MNVCVFIYSNNAVAGWVDMSFRANLTGACDKWCKSSVERDPSIRATLKNPSPLLAAGEDTEAALPGDSLEDRATAMGIWKTSIPEKL